MKILDYFKGLFCKKHIKVGLALGSGGAKGGALIGAMKAFEEEGIKFDIVAGTSIGSIVGAMYALGYTSDEMLGFLNNYEVASAKNLLSMAIKSVSVEELLDKIVGGKHFEDTHLPFVAVSTNLVTGEEVDINSGSLTKALAASSAMPPIFKPVRGESGELLIDGAFVNAVPADVVKKMGADVVVSVSLTDNPMNDISVLNDKYKNHGVKYQDRYHQAAEFSSFIFSPNLSMYKTTSIFHISEMYDIGYKNAKANMGELKAVLSRAGVKLN